MNVSAVFGGVVASGLVVGLVSYAAVTRAPDSIAAASSSIEDPLPDPAPALPEPSAPVDTARSETAPMQAARDTPAMPRAPDMRRPEMGVVRVDAQGGAVVAGTGPASADVVLRLDGTVIASARTDAGGSFVTLFDLPASTDPQRLTLETRTDRGIVTRAAESVIVAPTLPGQPAIRPAPVADRSTSRPSAGQVVAGQAAPDTDRAPSLDAGAATRLARAAPTDLVSPVEDPALVERTRAAAPVSATVRPATVGDPPVPGQDPDPSAVATDTLARGGPSSLTAPDPTRPPIPVRVPDTSASVTPVAQVQTGTAPDLASAPGDVSGTPPVVAAAPRLIRTGPDGLSVQTPRAASQPQVLQDLGIDVISYDAIGAVQLAGRAGVDAELRIYLDNRPVQTVRVGPDGQWTAPLSDVASGVYTLRIDEVDAVGTVTARVETPFQRTAPEIAAQARREGATAITVQPGYTLWALSEGYFGDGVEYVQLFEANRDQIRDPDLIYPGQVFRLPEAE